MKTENQRRLSFVALFLTLAGLLTLFRLWYGSLLPLSFDEAYYWQWSKHLALSYPDHPPLTAWLIRVGTTMFGDTALGVRLGSIVLGGVGFALVVSIARKAMLSRKNALAAGVIATLLPAVAAGSLLATPDIALAVAWLAAIRCAMEPNPPVALYGVALCTGIGLWAKLTALLIPALLFFSPAPLKEARRHVWGSLALGLLVALPYLWAASQNVTNSFFFQGARLAGDWGAASTLSWPLRTLQYLGELFGGTIGLVTPLVAISLIWKARQRTFVTQNSLLWAGLLIPVGATALAALVTHPEQNWAAFGHPLAAVLLFLSLKPPARVDRRPWLMATGATIVVLAGIIHVHGLTSCLPLAPQRDPMNKLLGWNGLRDLHRTVTAGPIDGVLLDNYALNAQYVWHNRHSTPVPTADCHRPGSTLPPGTWLIVDEMHDLDGMVPPAHCEEITPLKSQFLTDRARRPMRELRLSLGLGCKSACER